MISVCILNWETTDLLLECLRSLEAAADCEPLQVLVGDNASSDFEREAVLAALPCAEILQFDTNIGFAAGNNRLVERARGAWIVILNPDTKPRPRSLCFLRDFLRAHAEYGAAAPQLKYPDGQTQASVRALPTPSLLWAALFGRGAYRQPHFDYSRTQDAEQPMMSCLMIRRACLEQVGMLDESFPIFFNDVDWAKRCWESGWKIAYVSQAVVEHYHGAGTERAGAKMIIASHLGLAKYARKHWRSSMSAIGFAAFLALNAIVCGARYIWRSLSPRRRRSG
jgi:hypothetical protein